MAGSKGGGGKPNINIEEDVRIAIHYMIDKFVQDEKLNEFDFPVSFTREHRAYIHDYVKNKSLKSRSHGKGEEGGELRKFGQFYELDFFVIFRQPTLPDDLQVEHFVADSRRCEPGVE